MKTTSLVLLSGGQDSTTCLAIAQAECKDVEAITFNYGQRHLIELDQAHKIAHMAGVPLTELDARFIAQLGKNALTDASVAIEQREGQLPSTFVPGRNLFFLSMAAAFAYQKDISSLYIGVCQTDYSGYPDCRDSFIKSATQSLAFAMDYTFTINTPLMWLSKAQSIRLMQRMNKLHWYQESHTCYKGQRPACGRCPACVLRLKGFEEAGLTDPLAYKS